MNRVTSGTGSNRFSHVILRVIKVLTENLYFVICNSWKTMGIEWRNKYGLQWDGTWNVNHPIHLRMSTSTHLVGISDSVSLKRHLNVENVKVEIDSKGEIFTKKTSLEIKNVIAVHLRKYLHWVSRPTYLNIIRFYRLDKTLLKTKNKVINSLFKSLSKI